MRNRRSALPWHRVVLAIVIVPILAVASLAVRAGALPWAATPDGPAGSPARGAESGPAAPGFKTSHWVDGVSRIRKLNSNITVGRGRFEGTVSVGSPGQLTGDLTLPPSPSYFVTFGFMPVTGVVEIVQDRPAQGVATVKPNNDTFIADVDMTANVVIRLHDVKVDSKPLDVGANCRTAEPVAINIKGQFVLRNDPSDVPPTKTRSVYGIPKFTGCGVTEDLSPLMTGLVSGPGNTLDSVLTLRCFRDQNCPPDRGPM